MTHDDMGPQADHRGRIAAAAPANARARADDIPSSPDGNGRIVISPHRSLGRDGILIVLAVAATGLAIVTAWVSGPAGWFVSIPALAVFASLSFAFWLNTRRAERVEIIDISASAIRVMTSYLGRHELVACFNPYWVRVELSDAFKIEKRLILSQSGRAVSIGECLSVEEREHLAGTLRARLERVRIPTNPPSAS
jgi:uncharacterized membrane protein